MKNSITSADVFAIKTHLKLATLVGIATKVEQELGISPKCTVYERWHRIATVTGMCRTKDQAEAAIREDLK
jgi:hypothetical protein